MDGPLRSWIQAAMERPRSNLATATASTFPSALSPFSVDDDDISMNEEIPGFPSDPRKNPGLRKLVEGILYSRRFLLSYIAVLLVVLVGFGIAQWAGVMQRAYARRAAARRARKSGGNTAGSSTPAAEATSGATSSSSSTLEGTATPPDAPARKAAGKIMPDERQPLLGGENGRSETRKPASSTRVGVLSATLHSIRAWLMFQPRPLPVVHKELPSNGASLLILAFLGLNVFYLFFNLELSRQMVFVFADRCAILICMNLPFLYLFAAKNQPITWLTGYSYESLNIFHRRLGELMCLLAFLHGAGVFLVWYDLLRRFGMTLQYFLTRSVVLLGLGAFVSYELLYLTSLRSFRQRCYETFLALHVFLQTAALVLLWFHHPRSRIYVGVALIIFVVDRLVYRLGVKSTTMRADLTILDDGQTVRVSSNWDIPKAHPGQLLYRRTVSRGWNAPDHVFVSVPALGRAHALQAHPFTVATPAPSKPRVSARGAAPEASEEGAAKHAWLSLLVRAQTGFSRDLLRHAQTNSSTRIRVDGPYGSTHPLVLLQQSDSLAVVVAGGSGVAVAFPLLWTLLNPASRPDLERQTRGLAAGPRKVCFLWVVRSRAHLSWLPKQRIDELREWGADVVVSEPTAEAGRPDVGEILADWVREYAGDGGRAGVVVSGPDGLNRDARNACSRLAGEGKSISVSVEKFGW